MFLLAIISMKIGTMDKMIMKIGIMDETIVKTGRGQTGKDLRPK